jgi:hypothetical protein
MKPGPTEPLADRFWRKVKKGAPDECWPWTAYLAPRGYGMMTYAHKTKRSHRWAWELTNGPIPDGVYVCHTCDNPRCCNPTHLWLGTQFDNMRDMVAKGRGASQKKSGCPRGHPYDRIRASDGARECSICNREKHRRHRRQHARGEQVPA